MGITVAFLNLPAEIRNRIYTHLFHNSVFRILGIFHRIQPDGNHDTDGFKMTDQYSRVCPQILATCRQIRSEATPILYGNVIFQSERLFPIDDFRSAVGPKNLPLIKHIYINLDTSTAIFQWISARHHIRNLYLPLPYLETLEIYVCVRGLSDFYDFRRRGPRLVLDFARVLVESHPSLKTGKKRMVRPFQPNSTSFGFKLISSEYRPTPEDVLVDFDTEAALIQATFGAAGDSVVT